MKSIVLPVWELMHGPGVHLLEARTLQSSLVLSCHSTETVCEYEVQYHRRLEQERAQWNQYRESVERELAELRRRLTEGQEEQNLEDDMKKVLLVRGHVEQIKESAIQSRSGLTLSLETK